MFAHQIIADLQRRVDMLKKEPYCEERDAYITLLEIAYMETIPRAIKFGFEDAESIRSGVNSRDYLFMSGGTPIKMPYQSMMFDFFQHNPSGSNCKASVVVNRYGGDEGFVGNWGEQYELGCFLYNKTNNIWQMLPELVFVKDGTISSYMKAFDIGEEKRNPIVHYCAAMSHRCIMLLNCKNIQKELVKAPRKLNLKRRKTGKQELFDYHVLNIVVPSKRKDYQEKGTPLSHNRVHLCRGHFKEYTTEHPLFGRLTGLYWWQPHVRGQNKDGIVMKDYKVTT